MFTERAQALIDLAKDLAFAGMRDALDLDCLLAAVGRHPEAAVRLAECLTQGDTAGLRARCPDLGEPVTCPGSLELASSFRALLEAALDLSSGIGVPDPVHPGLVDLRHLVCALACSGEACRILGGLTSLSREGAVRTLTAWYEESAATPSIAGLASRLRGLRDELLAKVFGQDHAVHAFVEGLYHSQLTAAGDQQRKAPAAVYVFAGPPGVGKTYLAELSARHLERPFRRFDMTSYSDHQSHNELVGFAPAYKGSQPGLLTGFVEKNPNAFLLFDEIEKAHLNAIQLFYQILDAGRLEDKFHDRTVSFRDAVIIFTTNAGRSLYDQPNRSGISAANSAYHRKTILSALEQERNPATGQPAFPPAICSRLGQGYPVMFNHLTVNELERVSGAELTRVEALLERQYFKSFRHDPILPMCLVYRAGGRVDARQVRAESEKFLKGELFRFSSLYTPERLDEVFGGLDQVHVTVDVDGTSTEASTRSLFEPPEPPRILLVADRRILDACREEVQGITWTGAETAEEVIDLLTTEEIDLVLLDIWIRRPLSTRAAATPGMAVGSEPTLRGVDFVPLSARALDQGRNILRKIHERSPETPVYLLSFTDEPAAVPAPDGVAQAEPFATMRMEGGHDDRSRPDVGFSPPRAVDDELFLACVREGGARGLIVTPWSIKAGPGGRLDAARLSESLAEVHRRLFRERKARDLASNRQVLVFDTAAGVRGTERELRIALRDLRLSRAIEADDAGTLIDDVQRPSTRFEDVLGATAAKRALGFVVDWLRDPRRYSLLGVRPPRGILLAGPPGTGKTMLARAVSGESQCTFVQTTATSFVTMWQGSGPQSIRDLFARARRYAPAVVFIDEIDAIGRTRRGSPGAGHGEEMALNALLTEMDGFFAPTSEPVIVLAATNLEDLLDPALKRRFDRTIEVDKPDRAARLLYLERAVLERKRSRVSRKAIEQLAHRTPGLTIADLERIVHEAAVLAVGAGQELTDELLEEAFEKVRIGEAHDAAPPEILERVARHECGHALIGWLGGSPTVKLTIVGRGFAAGYREASADGDEQSILTKPALELRIRALMGGRAAELVYYGDEAGLSTGVSDDLQKATTLATAMVGSFGMSGEFGQVALGDHQRLYDGALAVRVNEAAERIVRSQLEAAVRTLEENRPLVDRLVRELLERNTLYQEDLETLLPPLDGGAKAPA